MTQKSDFPNHGATVLFGQQHPGFERVPWLAYLLRMADVQASPMHERHFRAWGDVLVNGITEARTPDQAGIDAAWTDVYG